MEMVISDSNRVLLESANEDGFYGYTLFYPEDSLSFQFKIKYSDKNYIFTKQLFELDNEPVEITRIDNSKVAMVDGRAYYYFIDQRLLAIKSRDWPNVSFFITEPRDRTLMRILLNDVSCFFECAKTNPPAPISNPETETVEDSTLLLDPNNPEIPVWLLSQYADSSENSISEVMAYHQINDSISFAVIQTSGGSCQDMMIAVVKHGAPKSVHKIGSFCEPSDSNIYHHWMEYDIFKTGVIRSYRYRECNPIVADSIQCSSGVDSTIRTFIVNIKGDFKEKN
ncbi:hypothetical protein GYB22_12305 [bacterium]|nr:hypothetical protein [bacterium]